MDLRSGRQPDSRPSCRRGPGQGAVRAETRPLRERRGLYLRLRRAESRQASNLSGPRRSPICRPTGSPTPRSLSRARSSRTAIGSSSGRTIGSAFTAPRIIPSSAEPSTTGRPFRESTASSATRMSSPIRTRCEAAGLPSVFRLSESGQYRMSRIPLLDDAVSYTMSGRAAVAPALSDDVAEPSIGSLLLFHYPSTWNHVLGDHAVSFQVLPIGPMQTQVRTKWLVHKDAVEGKDYSVEELTHVWLDHQRSGSPRRGGKPDRHPLSRLRARPLLSCSRGRGHAIRRLVLPDDAAQSRRRAGNSAASPERRLFDLALRRRVAASKGAPVGANGSSSASCSRTRLWRSSG